MINPTIVAALCEAPDASPVDPKVIVTAKDATEDALLRYGTDALRWGLLAGHPLAPSKVPHQISLSLVVDRGHGQLLLLSRPEPGAKLNRQDLANVRRNEDFDIIEGWVASNCKPNSIHHVEAIATARLSGHEQAELAARMRLYDALV
jgi:hypothetical protein